MLSEFYSEILEAKDLLRGTRTHERIILNWTLAGYDVY
jgi:hypothetical protein